MNVSTKSGRIASDRFKVVLLVVLLTLIRSAYLHAQGNDIKFDHLSLEDGLSQITVKCIFQDSRGFLWFGTLDGLNKYDGYQFTAYKHDPLDPQSLSHSAISSIHEDPSGIIWIGTDSGLNEFNRDSESFTRYLHEPENPRSLSGNGVLSIYEDRSGIFWIGTLNSGINRFDPVQKTFTRYEHDPKNPGSLSDNAVKPILEDRSGVLWIGTGRGGLNKLVPSVNEGSLPTFVHFKHDPDDPLSLGNSSIFSIYEDHTGVLWIGTNNGLDQFDPSTGTFIHYQNHPDNPQSLGNNRIRSIFEDRSGTIWIGIYDGGLSRMSMSDRESGIFTRYEHDPNDPHSLSDNTIISFYEDRSGVLWIGTDFGGVNKLNRAGEAFAHIKKEPEKSMSLSDNMVQSIHEDQSGMIWIGTEFGLNKYDPLTKAFTHYKHDPSHPLSLSDSDISSIFEDRSGILWIGTIWGGLNKFDREKDTFTHYKHDPGKPGSLTERAVETIFEDRSGTLWIGNYSRLNQFDRATESFIHYKHDPDNPQSLSDNRIRSVYQDRSGTLWIGTWGGGLNKFLPASGDNQKGTFARYQNDPDKPGSLSHNSVWSIHEDRSGVLWFGTHVGLNRFDPVSETFKHYREKDGLPNDVIYDILEDNQGRLWMSTNGGISRFNPQSETFKNFDVHDGLQSNEFNQGAAYKTRNGEMYFGGINGFNAFYPDSIKDNRHVPPIVVTDFQVFNESVPIFRGDSSRERPDYFFLDKPISETDEIVLSYKKSVFSFEFAALHFALPERNQYAYMMEGFDEDWVNSGTRRFITYTNLDPGEYIFRVIGSNSDGVWNEKGAAIKIAITPPFWQTLWFRVAGGTSILALAFGWYKRRIRNIETQRKTLKFR